MAATDSSLQNVSSGVRVMKASKYTAIVKTGKVHSTSLPSRGPHGYRFKNKGPALVFIWSFSALFVFFSFSPLLIHKDKDKEQSPISYLFIIFIASFLLYPVFSSFFDSCCGKYSVVRWSLRALWLTSIIFCASSSLLQYFSPSSDWLQKALMFLLYASYVPIFVCLGVFVANVFQFITDQLADASSSELFSYIRWIVWVRFFSCAVAALSRSCTCLDYNSISYLLAPVLLTIAVASDFVFNHWLVKEPITGNPVLLIFRVLRFTVMNKYPLQRSGLTSWDSNHNSRIDLAKNIFGGPFTTLQVEDVKSFFRVYVVIIAGCLLCGIYIAIFPQYEMIMSHYGNYVPETSLDQCNNAYFRDCLEQLLFRYFGDLLVVVGHLLFELVLNPLFQRYIRVSVSILCIGSVGLFLLVCSLASCVIIELIAHSKAGNIVCCLYNTTCESYSLPLDYKWMIIPFILSTFGQYLVLTAFIAFLYAQSPYSMKNLLFGLAFGTLGFFCVVGYFIVKLIKFLSENFLPAGHFGCVFWCILLTLGLLLVILIVYLIAFKYYKKRQRHDAELKGDLEY